MWLWVRVFCVMSVGIKGLSPGSVEETALSWSLPWCWQVYRRTGNTSGNKTAFKHQCFESENDSKGAEIHSSALWLCDSAHLTLIDIASMRSINYPSKLSPSDVCVLTATSHQGLIIDIALETTLFSPSRSISHVVCSAVLTALLSCF